MDTPRSEGPEPGRLAGLPARWPAPPALAWRLEGWVLPLLWLWEQLAWRPGLAPLTKSTAPGGAPLTTAGSWLAPWRQRPARGQAETAGLEREPRGLARKPPSRAGGWGLWRAAGPARVCMCGMRVCKCVHMCVCVHEDNGFQNFLWVVPDFITSSNFQLLLTQLCVVITLLILLETRRMYSLPGLIPGTLRL